MTSLLGEERSGTASVAARSPLQGTSVGIRDGIIYCGDRQRRILKEDLDMQILGSPEDVKIAIGVLRLLRGWTQEEMARAAGVHKSLLSLYEQGKTVPTPKTLSRLMAAVKLPLSAFESILHLVRLIRYWAGGSDEATADLATSLARVVGTTVQVAVAREVAALLVSADRAASLSEGDSAETEELWGVLEANSLERRQMLVREVPDFQTVKLCERLCAESERELAAADAGRALELGSLALEVAERVGGTPEERARLQGYAWAHIGGARRAAGDLSGAEEAFARARELWEEDAEGDDALPEDCWLDLQGRHTVS
jgi:transcriptional regulator with XRE-family HTH domain